MKQFKTDLNGGLPLVLDDIRFLQDAQKEALFGASSSFTLNKDVTILSGCERIVNSGNVQVTAGYVVMNGEIYYMPEQNYAEPAANFNEIFRIKTTYLPEGEKIFEDGGIHQTYVNNQLEIYVTDQAKQAEEQYYAQDSVIVAYNPFGAWETFEIGEENIVIGNATNESTSTIPGTDPRVVLSGTNQLRYKIIGKTCYMNLRLDSIEVPSKDDATFDAFSIELKGLPFTMKSAFYNKVFASANANTVVKQNVILFSPGLVNRFNLIAYGNKTAVAFNRFYEFESTTSINVAANATTNIDVAWGFRGNFVFEIE